MNCCEEVGPLKSVASFGVDFLKNNRLIFMLIADALVILVFCLSCVSMAGGATDDEDYVKDNSWLIADPKGLNTIYYGTKMVVSGKTDTLWKSCKGVSYCDDCESAGQTALNCSVFLFLLSISLFISSVSRSRMLWDMVLHKIAAIVVSSLALLIMIIGMGAWNNECADAIRDKSKNTDFELGPGLNAMVAAFFFVLIILVIHICIPVEPNSASSDEDGNFKPHDPENRA